MKLTGKDWRQNLEEAMPEIRRLIATSHPINAVKLYRSVSGMGLTESIFAIYNLELENLGSEFSVERLSGETINQFTRRLSNEIRRRADVLHKKRSRVFDLAMSIEKYSQQRPQASPSHGDADE
jgi:hypothetical protein